MRAGEWRQELVDMTGGSKFSSLKIDSSGNAHVSYVDDPQHLLKYGFWDRNLNKWFTTKLDSSAGFCSLALDSHRNPHISYLDFGGGKLKYAHWNGSAWIKQVIQINAKVIDYYTSIALDSKDNPSISFYEYWGSGQDYLLHLRNAWWNGKFWQVSTVDSTPGSGKFNASATDSHGNPHIAYANVKSENASLRYARWNGQAWESEVLEGMGVSGYSAFSVAIALDKTDTPHITYTDVTNRQLKYATRRNGKWQIQIVDSLSEVAYPDRNGIALDDQGRPYISYFDPGRGLLKLAYQKNDKWAAEIVDQNSAGFTSSIQIDRGTIWLTYADETGQLLKCARQTLEQAEATDHRSISGSAVLSRGK
ncbi:MAG TPA: hypothetical protein VNH18_04260 [Bryobacteraceae bacterium]|nr:hypothetical protein [Bryobacteraceae bacterium]HXJ38467.1 hypothetical protein [Bryobacteraceae bacterium]